MHYRVAILLLCAAAGGCAVFTTDDMHYSVYFQPYSTELDQQARETVATAATVARDNPVLPVALVGYAAPPDPLHDDDRLSAQRASIVQQALVRDGIPANRISTSANGTTDPKGLPNLSVRRVDITIGR